MEYTQTSAGLCGLASQVPGNPHSCCPRGLRERADPAVDRASAEHAGHAPAAEPQVPRRGVAAVDPEVGRPTLADVAGDADARHVDHVAQPDRHARLEEAATAEPAAANQAERVREQ